MKGEYDFRAVKGSISRRCKGLKGSNSNTASYQKSL